MISQSKANPSISRLGKLSSPEKVVHHVLLLFYLFRDEKGLLFGFPPMNKKNCKRKESSIL